LKFLLKFAVVVLTVLISAGVLFFYLPLSQNARFMEGEEIVFLIYDGGIIEKKIVFPPYSNMHIKLNNWLSGNKDGWQHSIVNYVPEVYFRSKGISVKLRGNYVVINYAQYSNEHHTQIIKELNDSEFKNELLHENL